MVRSCVRPSSPRPQANNNWKTAKRCLLWYVLNSGCLFFSPLPSRRVSQTVCLQATHHADPAFYNIESSIMVSSIGSAEDSDASSYDYDEIRNDRPPDDIVKYAGRLFSDAASLPVSELTIDDGEAPPDATNLKSWEVNENIMEWTPDQGDAATLYSEPPDEPSSPGSHSPRKGRHGDPAVALSEAFGPYANAPDSSVSAGASQEKTRREHRLATRLRVPDASPSSGRMPSGPISDRASPLSPSSTPVSLTDWSMTNERAIIRRSKPFSFSLDSSDRSTLASEVGESSGSKSGPNFGVFTFSSNSERSSKLSRNDQSAKRPLPDPQGDKTQKDPSENPTSSALKRRKTDESKVQLACPFQKADPARHRACGRLILRRIKDIKQHIVRRHKAPIHCLRCFATFQSNDELVSHARINPPCETRQGRLDGISGDQQQLLSKRATQGKSIVEQWYDMWDIIFPGAQRPATPYVDPELSDDLSEYNDYVVREGPRILLEHLGHLGLPEGSSPALQDALASILSSWNGQRATPEEIRNPMEHVSTDDIEVVEERHQEGAEISRETCENTNGHGSNGTSGKVEAVSTHPSPQPSSTVESNGTLEGIKSVPHPPRVTAREPKLPEPSEGSQDANNTESGLHKGIDSEMVAAKDSSDVSLNEEEMQLLRMTKPGILKELLRDIKSKP